MSVKMRVCCIGFIILAAIGLVASLPPIPQNTGYHVFADEEMWYGIINAENVLSNIAFVIAGIAGLMRISHLRQTTVALLWRFFFSAAVLVGLGSAYYHWLPSNDTLVWDRLPMTLCFAALTACVCAERLGAKVGRLLIVPLVVSGMLSVFYWWFSEKYGFGDLRPYILVQYLPMIVIPLMIFLFPQNAGQNKPYWLLLISYVLAKGFELNDNLIFNLTNHVISGHTLKHLAAAAGIWMLRPTIPAEANENSTRSLFRKFLDKANIL